MADTNFEVDLTNCDREPIHALGTVQPFGFLICLSADWLVQRASANVVDTFQVTAEDMLGTSVNDYICPDTVHTLRNRLTLLRDSDSVERVFGYPLQQGGAPYDFALHIVGSSVILEGEPSTQSASTDAGSMIRSMMARLDASEDLTGFFREGARQVRALTGFDRVMVYQFDRDGSGIVVAEAARTGIGSFLGLRYPASDIPKQARALYLRAPFRIIADVDATPVAIVPAIDERGAPLDLSLSVLRAVSPIHIEYLKNMGVHASMSISIIVDGQLWGLFACHHYAGPRLPAFERRSVAELFGQMFALKLESRERAARAAYEASARATSDRLLASVASDAALIENPEWLGAMMRQVVSCDGVAIWIDGELALNGLTPPSGAIPALIRRLNAMMAGAVFATDHITDILPQAAEYADVAAGVLAIPISRTPRDYVLLFRQEVVRTVNWAGDPHKPAQLGPNGPRLTPRQSFELWAQEVRSRSTPFTEAELRVAEMLRVSLIEVVLRLSDEAREERQRSSERQELLIAELNHRVRNILSLIRGLIRQSRDGEIDLAAYIGLLEGRIESLARAHDQITRDNWAAAPLAPLIETEAAAYLGTDGAGRVSVEGAAVALQPQAYSTVALVVHELMTNSCKYGALSDNGRVMVSWDVDDAGNLLLQWRERGGPAVRAPERKGFGTTIITRSVPYDLGGQAEIRYQVAGLEADFMLPARHIAAGEDARKAHAIAAPPPPAPTGHERYETSILSGPVLLVEDSLIIAMDAEDVLARLGATHVVTVATTAHALEEIAREEFQVALLDFNLGTETSLPVAERLLEKGAPFAFATGYGDQLRLPDEMAEVAVLQKPYTAHNMARTLEDLLRKA